MNGQTRKVVALMTAAILLIGSAATVFASGSNEQAEGQAQIPAPAHNPGPQNMPGHRVSNMGSGFGHGNSGMMMPRMGIPVVEVVEDSPAEAAGIQAGDNIIGVNGQQLDGRGIGELLQTLEPGDELTVNVLRTRVEDSEFMSPEELILTVVAGSNEEGNLYFGISTFLPQPQPQPTPGMGPGSETRGQMPGNNEPGRSGQNGRHHGGNGHSNANQQAAPSVPQQPMLITI